MPPRDPIFKDLSRSDRLFLYIHFVRDMNLSMIVRRAGVYHPLEIYPMNPTAITTEMPLHILLRTRRKELSLFQSQLAEALHVSPECIGQWECGRRRMELSKIPRIAAALQLDARELCSKALAEFHPLLYASLFGDDALAEHQPAPR
jgi:DNA-binding XRE family transcriptional regulator